VRTLEYQVHVDEARRASLQFPRDIAPGEHRIVIVVEEEKSKAPFDPLQGLPTVRGAEWLAGVSLRREDMYGDERRRRFS